MTLGVGRLNDMGSGGQQAEATVISRPPFISVVRAIRPRAVPVAFILAVLYAILIALAERLTALTDARWGLALHIGIVTALLVQASMAGEQPYHKLLVAL